LTRGGRYNRVVQTESATAISPVSEQAISEPWLAERQGFERHGGQRWFARYAAFLLAYLLFVILFGAWVRITGSGAGCGDHWPTCGGEIVPRAPSLQTLIEYTHRITSGTLGLMALALPVWAFRLFPPRHPARRAALATFVLVMVEAGIGAGLVLKQLVANDASLARAVAVALHLTNTLLLTAAAALTVAFARARQAAQQPGLGHGRGAPASSTTLDGGVSARGAGGQLLIALLVGLVLVAASGAVTALGDTLFPVSAGVEHPRDHFLVQLRVLHPLLACFMVCASVLCAVRFARLPRCRPWALGLGVTAGAQLVIGALNIALSAPGWLQLGHLLGAQLAWISAVLLTDTWYRAAR
jgi:cytochrome c oxidase assembly protein subunit 15